MIDGCQGQRLLCEMRACEEQMASEKMRIAYVFIAKMVERAKPEGLLLLSAFGLRE
jgi:hypothetical protein